MAGKFSQLMEKGRAFWARAALSQRVFLLGFGAVVIAAFIGMVVWLNQPDYRLLLGDLPLEDANRVVEMLKEEKVDYRLENDGTSVLVPADKVYDLRIKVAGSNTIQGAGQGFEIFDNIQVGETDFVQKMKYQRALQGELSRTIGEFPGVESARVHLVLPHKSLFIEEQQDPSASVVLKMEAGAEFGSKEVEPIVNLLVMAVEGLDKNHVSVSDSSGKVLYFPDEDIVTGLSNTQLEYKNTVQTMLERRIEEMLAPIIGPGKVIAKVNADLDFSQKTRRLELYDPENVVLRSSTRSESTVRGQSTLDAQTPDANFRGDSMTGGLSEQETVHENRIENFDINKEEQNIISAVGEISRLSVAVIVDGTYAPNEAGEMIFTPRSQEELDRIQHLIRNAVGYDSARGDSIEVSSIAFGYEDLNVEQQLSDIILDYVSRLGKPLLNTILVLLFLLLVVRPVVLAMIRPRVQSPEVIEGLEGLPAGESQLALLEGEEEIEPADMYRQIEDIKAHAINMAEQNMEQAVSILRGWLNNQEGASVGKRAA
ncbi:MAG: flagellar M-ring protein FliF [Desulfovibrionaceae bacterium]|nr:flagellar M-ring protein FliF [Desulfovibrionaceae bacterium]